MANSAAVFFIRIPKTADLKSMIAALRGHASYKLPILSWRSKMTEVRSATLCHSGDAPLGADTLGNVIGGPVSPRLLLASSGAFVA